MIDIILASSSPRRQELLKQTDIEFTTLKVDVDETVEPHEAPNDYIVRMVKAKALAACDAVSDKEQGAQVEVVRANNDMNSQHKLQLILCADTIGVLADATSILVKPASKEDAFAMWQKMSNAQHSVWTAVELIVINDKVQVIHHETILEKTTVTFIELDQDDMEKYWQTGEPQDKAGGYAIQGKGSKWVESINGSYTNVVGLPLAQTIRAIKRINSIFNMQ